MTRDQVQFAIIAIAREVKSADGNIMARDGERFWLENEQWIDATGARFDRYPDGRGSASLKTFTSRDDAEAFAKKWKGHPWWVKPKSFEVVEVEPLFEVVTGYRRVC